MTRKNNKNLEYLRAEVLLFLLEFVKIQFATLGVAVRCSFQCGNECLYMFMSEIQRARLPSLQIIPFRRISFVDGESF